MSYVNLSKLGSNQLTSITDPLMSCSVPGMEAMFLTGNSYSNVNNSQQCQLFMAGYCANNWDGTCEYVSTNTTTSLPAVMGQVGSAGDDTNTMGTPRMSLGDALVRQTAQNKYLTHMSSNCTRVYEPFDATVPQSPMISQWMSKDTGGQCIGIYDVNPSTIDNDPVMNKLLNKPAIAMNVLIPIYNNRLNSGTLSQLSKTKLYKLFMSDWFQAQVKNQ